MKLYKFFHFCAKQKRMCNSLVSFFNLREAALSIIFYHKIITIQFSPLLGTQITFRIYILKQLCILINFGF